MQSVHDTRRNGRKQTMSIGSVINFKVVNLAVLVSDRFEAFKSGTGCFLLT